VPVIVYSPRVEPTTPNFRPWSITKAEWDGIASGEPSGGAPRTGATPESAAPRVASTAAIPLLPFIVIPIAAAILTVIVAVGWATSNLSAWWIVAFGSLSAVLVAWCLLSIRRMRRALRAWSATHSMVWESHGCVCPWCQTRVDRQPCPGHGFSRADQPALLTYWEALATRDSSAMLRTIDELRQSEREHRAVHGSRRILIRSAGTIAPGMFDAERTPLSRAVAAWPLALLALALLIITVPVLDLFFSRRVALFPLQACWSIVLIPSLVAATWSGWKAGRPHCAACGHPCTTDRPTLCPECGANLSGSLAVVRGTKARSAPWAGLLFILLLWTLPLAAARIVDALPVRAQNAVYSLTTPPVRYFENLDLATMSAADATATADLLIQLAESGREGVFAWEFIPKAIAAGKVPPSYRERAARASCRPTLEATLDTERGTIELRARPKWGTPLLGFPTSMRVVIGSHSTDGGKSWRSARGRPGIGEFRSGTHSILARCWLIVGPSTTHELPVEFNDQGAPILPDPAMDAYEVPLQTTIVVP
jgi:hypothetical protein